MNEICTAIANLINVVAADLGWIYILIVFYLMIRIIPVIKLNIK